MIKLSTNEDYNIILELLNQVHRSVAEDFTYCYQNNISKSTSYIYSFSNNIGVIVGITTSSESYIAISFKQDLLIEKELCNVEEIVNGILTKQNSSSNQLIINGKNRTIIKYFINKGYSIKDDGLQFSCLNCNVPYTNPLNLTISPYEQCLNEEYIKILDEAFNPLRAKLGKSLNYRKCNLERSIKCFQEANSRNDFYAFKKDNNIIGISILEKDIIESLAVNPKFQGYGYGKAMLKYCLHKITTERKYPKAFLYAVTLNTSAHRFYLNNGFKINAAYTELNCP